MEAFTFGIFIICREIFKFIMDLKNYFKNGKVYVWKETFAIIKLKKPNPNAFVNITDKNKIQKGGKTR